MGDDILVLIPFTYDSTLEARYVQDYIIHLYKYWSGLSIEYVQIWTKKYSSPAPKPHPSCYKCYYVSLKKLKT